MPYSHQPIKQHQHTADLLLKTTTVQTLLVSSRFRAGAVQAFAAEKSAGRLGRQGKQTRILLPVLLTNPWNPKRKACSLSDNAQGGRDQQLLKNKRERHSQGRVAHSC